MVIAEKSYGTKHSLRPAREYLSTTLSLTYLRPDIFSAKIVFRISAFKKSVLEENVWLVESV